MELCLVTVNNPVCVCVCAGRESGCDKAGGPELVRGEDPGHKQTRHFSRLIY